MSISLSLIGFSLHMFSMVSLFGLSGLSLLAFSLLLPSLTALSELNSAGESAAEMALQQQHADCVTLLRYPSLPLVHL